MLWGMHTDITPTAPQLNATVMASAGTGKTFLLVSRLLRLLLSGANPGGILAITFTRKAAAEMHTRLSQRLLQLACCSEAELEEQLRELKVAASETNRQRARRLYEWLLQQSQGIRTTTFHAFCQDILRRFPIEAEVPPGFELLEQVGELRQAAWDTLQTEASRSPDGLLATALQELLDYTGSLDTLHSSLNAFLQHRGDWWALVEGAKDPLAHAAESLRQQLKLDDPDSDPLAGLFTSTQLDELAEFAELLRQHPIKTNLAILDELAIARNEELPFAPRFDACLGVFFTKGGEPRSRKPSGAQAKNMGTDGEARYLALHHSWVARLLAILDQQRTQAFWRASQAWYLAGYHLLEHFQRLKQEQRLLDFADLEWQACQLLNRSDHAQWVQYKLDQRIEHLLVDEFQDTNPTQWRLLLPLLQEMAAGNGERARSVFLVGDAKQSIYRFRRAEPRLFQLARDWLGEHLQAHTFPLHTSWRSAPAIMDCVNRVFGESGPLGGVLRDFSQHQTHHLSLPGLVCVLPLITPSQDTQPTDNIATGPNNLRNPLLYPRVIPQQQHYLQEGQQIAQTIQSLIGEGLLVGEDDAARPLHYGDIIILVAKRSHVGDYEQALRAQHIPYVGAERGTLLESIEVQDLLALLDYLTSPANNLALARVLRSPIFACSDQELISLTQQGHGPWYQRLQALATDTDAALGRAARLLPHWQAQAGMLPIHDLLDRIYNEGNLLACYQAAAPPHLRPRVEANLTRFLELALDIDSGRYPSLGHFLARLQNLRESPDEAPDEAPSSGDERVRIMTIHAAKGLEAPLVFLADAGNSDARDKAWRALVLWPVQKSRPEALLWMPKKELQAEALQRLNQQERDEIQREKANLLYVAITRPRQLLFVSGCGKPNELDGSWYQWLRNAVDPLAAVSLDQACSMQQGEFHYAIASRQAVAPTTTRHTDPALTVPLRSPTQQREIAPSMAAGDERIIHASRGTDEDGRQLGVLIHRMLELLADEPGRDHAETRRQLQREFSLSNTEPLLQQACDEALGVLRAPQLSQLFTPQEGVEFLNEVPIIYADKGALVHGIIDRLRIDSEEVWVIDYKSHRLHGDAAILAERFRPQLAYYQQGAARLWPQHKVRSFVLFTHAAMLYELTAEGDIQP